MLFVYAAAVFFLILASYGHGKASSSLLGGQPMPGTPLWHLYSWFGGGLSTLGIIALLIGGVVYLSWWVPVGALFGSLILAGIVYSFLPVGVAYAIFGFPIGALLGVAWVILR
jgi:hypothetical protein